MKSEKWRGKFKKDILSISLLLFITASFSGCAEKKDEVSPAVKVVLSKPVYMLFQDKLRVQGNVESTDHANICARVDGTVSELLVTEGQRVKKGQLLFQTDKINLENHMEISSQKIKVAETVVKRSEVDLHRANIKYDKDKIDYERARTLIDKNVISKTSFEKAELIWKDSVELVRLAEAVLEYSKASLEQARGDFAIAKKELEDSMVKAPFAGVITDKYIEKGEYAKKGIAVVRLSNPDILEISLLISSKYYSQIIPGTTVALVVGPEGKNVIEEKVSYRSPSIDPITRTFEIKINLSKRRSFVSGMLCEVDLILSSHEAYGIPSEAIIQKSNNKYVVFTVIDKKAEPIEVNPGIISGNFTELIDGEKLKEADIIVQGQSFLSKGTSVLVLKGKI